MVAQSAGTGELQWLHLCREVKLPLCVSWIWLYTIWWWWCSSNTGALGNAEYPFIAVVPRSTLAWSVSTWKGPIYGSNRSVWYSNCVQTNDLCKIELFEIELFELSKFLRWSMRIFIIKGFRTILFIFIVISTTFRLICPLAFFRCLSNSGTFTELRLCPLLNPRGLPVLILLAKIGYKC